MLGWRRFASSNKRRKLRSASPMYFPSASAPLREKKFTGCGPFAACPNSARTAAVLPVPGGPCSSTPRPEGTPSFSKISGYVNGNSASSFRTLISGSIPAKVSKPPPRAFSCPPPAPPPPKLPPTVTHSIFPLSLVNLFSSRVANACSSSFSRSFSAFKRAFAATTLAMTPRVRSTLVMPLEGRLKPSSVTSSSSIVSKSKSTLSKSTRRLIGLPDAFGAGPAPIAKRSNNGVAPLLSPATAGAVKWFAVVTASASSPFMVFDQTGAGVFFALL
mmetsp:Transcript_496/g.1683  ORF Transcript_496/g.1683 Transcript_496/m.1683 type:complete len:274 (-) Transcript_496:635-1456(-)